MLEIWASPVLGRADSPKHVQPLPPWSAALAAGGQVGRDQEEDGVVDFDAVRVEVAGHDERVLGHVGVDQRAVVVVGGPGRGLRRVGCLACRVMVVTRGDEAPADDWSISGYGGKAGGDQHHGDRRRARRGVMGRDYRGPSGGAGWPSCPTAGLLRPPSVWGTSRYCALTVPTEPNTGGGDGTWSRTHTADMTRAGQGIVRVTVNETGLLPNWVVTSNCHRPGVRTTISDEVPGAHLELPQHAAGAAVDARRDHRIGRWPVGHWVPRRSDGTG